MVSARAAESGPDAIRTNSDRADLPIPIVRHTMRSSLKPSAIPDLRLRRSARCDQKVSFRRLWPKALPICRHDENVRRSVSRYTTIRSLSGAMRTLANWESIDLDL